MNTLLKTLILITTLLVSQLISQEIINVEPDSILIGTGLSISITGSDTHFKNEIDETDSVWISFDDTSGYYIYCDCTIVHDSTHLDAIFFIPEDAKTGDWDLFVTQVSGYPLVTSSNIITIYDEGEPSDPDSQFTKITEGDIVTLEARSYGCSWGDYDNDGYLDLFVANYLDEENFLYHNNGNNSFTFTDILGRKGYSYSGSWGDYDNDGNLDLFVANYNQDNYLYHNTGSGSINEINTGIIVNDLGRSKSSSWGDYDNDGNIDLYVANYYENFLYNNNSDGSFTKITTGSIVNDEGSSYGCCWGDYNNDGNLDLFVANYRQDNSLYRNNGDGTFIEITTGDIVNDGGRTSGCSWGDFNNDGYLDLFAVNRDDSENNFLYANNRDGTFSRVTGVGLDEVFKSSRDCSWGDYNNDGNLDLFIANSDTNSLYRNNGDGSFTRITSSAIVNDEEYSYACSWGDYDNDGDLDLFIANQHENYLYQNNGNNNNWITIKLKGSLSNVFGLGSKVKVKATINGNAVWQLREISDRTALHANFGLGDAVIIDSLYIHWSSGIQQVLTNLDVNQILEIVEPAQSIFPEFCLKTEGPIEGGITSISDNIFYAPSSNDKIYRFDSTGTVEYNLSVDGDIKSSSTITSDHNVYIASTDKNLYSFNSSGVSNTGWPISLGSEASASVAVDDDKNVYIGTQNGIFQAVSSSGDILWSYNVGASIYSSAVISNENILYIVNYNGRLYAFDLSTINPENVNYIWRYDLGNNVISSPALDDSGNVYISTLDGKLFKLSDDNSSANLIWEYQVDDAIESSPVIDSEYNIYFGCNDGNIYAVNKNGDLQWKMKTNGAVKSTGTIANGKIFIGSNDRSLYALSLFDGSIVWRYYAMSPISCPILYESGKVYFGTMNGKIESIPTEVEGSSILKISANSNSFPIWGTFQGNNGRTGNQNDIPTYLENISNKVPNTFNIFQNYPNPFNPNTRIRYQLSQKCHVKLVLYNLLGQKVYTFVNEQQQAGTYDYQWKADGFTSGVYFYRLTTDKGFVQTRKMILLK